MKQIKRVLSSLVTVVLALSLFLLVACAPGAAEAVEAAATASPTAAPTATPGTTPVPTPIPTPTLEPVPELTDQEAEAEIASLGTFPLDEQIPINYVTFVLYSRTDDTGEKHYYFELTRSHIRISANRDILARLWDDSYLFEFSSNYDYLDYAPQQVAIVPLFESLQDVTVEYISGLPNLTYICAEKGIPYRRVTTNLANRLGMLFNDIGNWDEPFTYRKYAEYYVRTLARANRVVASDFTGPMAYVEPEQTPVASTAPTP